MATSRHLWAVGYDDVKRASEVREEIVRLGWAQNYLLLGDVAVAEHAVRRDRSGDRVAIPRLLPKSQASCGLKPGLRHPGPGDASKRPRSRAAAIRRPGSDWLFEKQSVFRTATAGPHRRADPCSSPEPADSAGA